MLSQFDERMGRHSGIRLWLVFIASFFLLTGAVAPARAQGGFISGSTGADGPFNPPSQVPPGTQIQGDCTNSCIVTLPLRNVPNHIFNFTTINIPTKVTVRFILNMDNTPVIMLATGDVTINGSIDISGKDGGSFAGGVGGPGGGKGGNGGVGIEGLTQGQSGDGPGRGVGGGSPGTNSGGGGGYALAGQNGGGTLGGQGGQAYGGLTLLPLLGGSGGGGGSSSGVNGTSGTGGGGGGGGILIASSSNIIFNANPGQITARGGNRIGTASAGSGGCGSGGAIRLIANTISGGSGLHVNQNGCSSGGGAGSPGFIRIEAFDHSQFFPNPIPSTTTSFAQPGLVTPPSTTPSLRIASVGGISAPASPLGSFQMPPDIVLPSTQSNPVTVALEATNLPVGTIVDVTLTPERGAPTTVQSTPLSGTEANSTATASLSLSNVISVISARVVINLNPMAANRTPLFIDGERVDRMEVMAAYGGASEVIYVTASGRRIKATGR